MFSTNKVRNSKHVSIFEGGRSRSLFTNGLLSVLGEMLSSLSLISDVTKAPEVNDETTLPETLQEKLDEIYADKILLDGIVLNKEQILERYKIKKRVHQIKNILSACYDEMIKHNSFNSIIHRVNNIQSLEQEERELLENFQENKNQVRLLNNIIISERIEGLNDIQKATNLIGNLKDNIQVSPTLIFFFKML